MSFPAGLPAEDPMTPWIVGMAGGLGLLVGSFLNVVGLRLLRGESIVFPASHCSDCNTPIRPYDNIPVLSYLLLLGKCRACKKPISPQYPVVELATGALFAAIVFAFGLGWHTPFLLYFAAQLVVVTITDLRESLIFHVNSFGLIPAGLLYNLLGVDRGLTSATTIQPLSVGPVQLSGPFLSALIGVLGAFALFEGLILLTRPMIAVPDACPSCELKLTPEIVGPTWKRLLFGAACPQCQEPISEGFGHGDTYLLMGIGSFLGWELAVVTFLLGIVLQSVLALPLLVWNWVVRRQWSMLLAGSCSVGFGLLPTLFADAEMDFSLKMGLMLACMLLSLASIVWFILQIRAARSHTALPLGPALVVAALLCLFYGKDMLSGWMSR